VPFVTGWVNENHFAALPGCAVRLRAADGGCSLLPVRTRSNRTSWQDSQLGRAVGRDFKGLISLFVYVVAIALSFINPWISCALYVFVAIMWFIPDPRIERALAQR